MSERLAADPVHYQEEVANPSDEDVRYGYAGPVWYFYEENWAFVHGPFLTCEQASEACVEYARHLG